MRKLIVYGNLTIMNEAYCNLFGQRIACCGGIPRTERQAGGIAGGDGVGLTASLRGAWGAGTGFFSQASRSSPQPSPGGGGSCGTQAGWSTGQLSRIWKWAS